MLILTKLNGEQFTLNCDLIETIQETPDTIIRLSNGNVYIVEEPMQEVIEKTISYRKKIFKDIINNSREDID